MLSNWKPKLGAFLGFIGTVFGILQFFGVSAKEIRDFMTANYLWLALALGSFILFVWGCVAWWRSSRITAENAQTKIRLWLDKLSIAHGVVTEPFQDWIWGLRVPLVSGPLLFISNTSGRPDSILFRGGINLLNPELRITFGQLGQREKNELFYKLRLAASREKFFFYRADEKMEWVTFDHWIPIRSLSQSAVIDMINQVYF